MIDEIILTEDQKEQLNELSEQYKEASDNLKSYEAKEKALKSILKETLKDFGVTKYVSNSGISLSVSSRPNVSFDENLLLDYCKKLNIPELVQTKEYVDMEKLESLLYNGTIQAESLKQFQVVKPDIVTLRCTQKKILTE